MNRKRLIATVVPLLLLVIYLLHDRDHIKASLRVFDSQEQRPRLVNGQFPLPKEYGISGSQELNTDSKCASRFGSEYIRAFSKSAANYCTNTSSSSLNCFTHKAHDTRTDSFCVGSPALVDMEKKKKFKLQCDLRSWQDEPDLKDVPPLNRFPRYWYQTGPRVLFDKWIDFKSGVDNDDDSRSVVSPEESTSTLILVQREDTVANLWHTLMQVMSLSLSLDILQTTISPETDRPILVNKDIRSSQVVILDEYEDGPFYDLWEMVAGMPTTRGFDVTSTSASKIVLPLPGGSNPIWGGDWEDLSCDTSRLLSAFVRRILDFYKIPDRPQRPQWPLATRKRLTLIDRKTSRRLLNQEACFSTIKARFPDIEMQLVDFAEMTLAEQIRTARSTDILVGVHGAGLTHELFMMPNSTLVEILPPTLEYKGFKNMAKFMGHRYFSGVASMHQDDASTGDWHYDDVFMDEDKFLALIQRAIMRKD